MKRIILLGLIGVALAPGCGKKGPPILPERRLPAAVQDLSVEVQGRQVNLTWTNPKARADKTPLRDLSAIHVFRRADPVGLEARPAVADGEGVVGFDRIAVLGLQKEGPEVRVEGRRGQFLDEQGLVTGQRYTYVVTGVDAQRRASPPSNRVSVNLLAAPRAPLDLRAEAGDGRIRLAWQAPNRSEDGSPLVGSLRYHVFRTSLPDAPRARPLTPEPLASTEFLDLGVENETVYYYTVRAILVEAGSRIQSQDSPVVAAKPEDTTPPGPPRNLVAVPAQGAVRLAWESSPDADVAGYLVHRSTVSGRSYARLTQTPQPGTTFVDPGVRRGATYFYVVTAVDRSPRANQSVPSAEARVTVP
jgi:hypothetical protein